MARHTMNRPTWLQINLSRLDTNVSCWRRALYEAAKQPNDAPKLCAVVKADAYGLGVPQIAPRLAGLGADMLGVYCLSQAEQLFDLGIRSPVLMFMPALALGTTGSTRQAMTEGRLHLSIHHPRELRVLAQVAARLDRRLPVHLYIDTGMSRGGLSADQFAVVLGQLPSLPSLKLAGAYTHFATGDDDVEFVDEQLKRFDAVLAVHQAQLPKGLLIHVASTYSACRHSRFHRSMTRLGLGLYGYGPTMLPKDQTIPELRQLEPVVRWSARLVHVSRFPKNATVGYGCTYTLDRESKLGLVPVGYGDGYPVALSNRAVVQVHTARTGQPVITAPVLGQVNMDQIVIDLTEVAGVRVGDRVDLISDDSSSPCCLERLAGLAQTNCYEMLCRLSQRLPREYKDLGRK